MIFLLITIINIRATITLLSSVPTTKFFKNLLPYFKKQLKNKNLKSKKAYVIVSYYILNI